MPQMSRKWFKGTQLRPDLADEGTRAYLRASLRCREQILATWRQPEALGSFDQFNSWLDGLHAVQRYKGRGSRQDSSIIMSIGGLDDALVKVSAKFRDGFVERAERTSPGVSLPGARLSRWADHLFYRSPSLARRERYLQAAWFQLRRLAAPGEMPLEERVDRIARMFFLLNATHLYEEVNLSLFMNLANALLEDAGLRGIEHGILDFVGMSLSSRTAIAHFRQEVARANPGRVKPPAADPRSHEEWAHLVRNSEQSAASGADTATGEGLLTLSRAVGMARLRERALRSLAEADPTLAPRVTRMEHARGRLETRRKDTAPTLQQAARALRASLEPLANAFHEARARGESEATLLRLASRYLDTLDEAHQCLMDVTGDQFAGHSVLAQVDRGSVIRSFCYQRRL